MGGPGISSARHFDESQSTVTGISGPPRTSANPMGNSNLLDLIRVDVNGELPQIDYFRGNSNLNRTGNTDNGPGSHHPMNTSQSQSGDSSAYAKPQFPSWH